jgi:S1-C subfamily serine protease
VIRNPLPHLRRPLLIVLLVVLLHSMNVLAQSPKVSLSGAEIFRRVKPSVVLILGSPQDTLVQGSGFVVSKDRVATNHHVIKDVSQAVVKFSDGSFANVESIVSDDESTDLAVLAVQTGNRPPITPGDELALQEGDPVSRLVHLEGSNSPSRTGLSALSGETDLSS